MSDLSDLTAAVNRLATAVEALIAIPGASTSWPPPEVDIHPALKMPPPKGYKCPVCGHECGAHRAAGCDWQGCDCEAPHGRLMPSEPAPDDLSELDGR